MVIYAYKRNFLFFQDDLYVVTHFNQRSRYLVFTLTQCIYSALPRGTHK